VIVRIATEAQYRLDDEAVGELNELDNAAIAACEAGSESSFRSAYDRLVSFVRERGSALPDDELAQSDVILPPPDVSIDEARAEFSGEGLIPG